MPLSLKQLLQRMVEEGGSNLHLTANAPPRLRIDGELRSMDMLPLSLEEVQALAYSVLTDAQRRQFERELQLDFSFGIENLARFRAALYRQRGAVGAMFTSIASGVPNIRDLGLPEVAATIGERPHGLVLVAGGTGSGKATTLTALLDHINRKLAVHLLVVEQPIEFLLDHQRAQVTQREVLLDTPSFDAACRGALRQDVDVVAIGEIRDHETARAALRLAELGRLVLTTLFAGSAVQALNHFVDYFPPAEQPRALFQLADTLEAVLYQALLPRPQGYGRVVALEVLLPDARMRRSIRGDDLPAVERRFRRGGGAPGSCALDEVLAELVGSRRVTGEAARAASRSPEHLERLLAGAAKGWRGAFARLRR